MLAVQTHQRGDPAQASQMPDRWPDLMDRDTAAAYWSISPRKLSELVSSGVITGRKLGPRCVRYSRREMDAAASDFDRGKGQSPD